MHFPEAGELFLEKYQLLSVLGEGGFARVFLATEEGLGRSVALKVLKPRDDGYPPGTQARFEREVKIIANLSDPHTVTLYDWGETADGLLYMVFEYIAGRDLVEILRENGPIDQASTVRIVEQVLQSLREAHRSQLLHRDVKPHNIRIYEYGGDPLCVKVLDFGIAKPVRNTGAEITAQGVLVGSPRYISPEQLFERDLSPGSDLYSLGLVMYEMLLGRGALKGSKLTDQLPRLTGREMLKFPDDAPVSPRMREIVTRLLEYDPSARFATADQVLDALRELDTEPLAAPLRAIEPVEIPFEHLVPLATPTVTTATEQPTRPTIQIVALAALVLAALVGIAATIHASLGAQIPAPKPALSPAPPRPVRPPPTAPEPVDTPDVEVAQTQHVGAGCGDAPPFLGPGPMTELAGLTRTSWYAFIPRRYDPQVRHQVLMLFHEDLESPASALDLTGFERYADERNIVILMPVDTSIRAWRGLDEVWRAQTILDLSAERLCLDTQSVIAFGHGTGGRAVERLHCVMNVKASASSAHRPEIEDRFCTPANPQPHLLIAPLADGYDPVEGGANCGSAKVSLSEFEQSWRLRNGCTEVKHSTRYPGARCFRWECDTAFVSCHAKGGHRWPGQARRGADVQACDGDAMQLPIADIVWEFFDTYSG